MVNRAKINDTDCNTKAQLINRIKETFETLPWDTVKAIRARFRSWIEAMIDGEGGFFE